MKNKYATATERLVGRRETIVAGVRARAERDVEQLRQRLREPFLQRDVCYAMRDVGRHWSEGLGTLVRLERFGYIRRALAPPETLDARVCWVFYWTELAGPKQPPPGPQDCWP